MSATAKKVVKKAAKKVVKKAAKKVVKKAAKKVVKKVAKKVVKKAAPKKKQANKISLFKYQAVEVKREVINYLRCVSNIMAVTVLHNGYRH